MGALQPGHIVQCVIGLAGETFRAVINVKQDRIERKRMPDDQLRHVDRANIDAGIRQAVAKNR